MTGILERFAAIGSLPDDTDDERIRKGALTPAAGIICALAPVGVITYLLLDLSVSAAIPLADVVVSVTSLIVFSRTKRYRLFRTLQLALMLALPFALQWSLGGFVPSSDRGAVGADVSARRAHVRRHPSGGAVVRRVPGVDRRIARARTRLTGGHPGGCPGRVPGRERRRRVAHGLPAPPVLRSRARARATSAARRCC